MARHAFWKRFVGGLCAAFLAMGGIGCAGGEHNICCKPPKFDPCCLSDLPVPKELNKVSLPPYVIETPDILMIDAIRVIPLPPYRVEPLDVLFLTAKGVQPEDPINGLYGVDPDGS